MTGPKIITVGTSNSSERRIAKQFSNIDGANFVKRAY
jgi:hypothetical protein